MRLRKEHRELVRYCVIGAESTALDFLLYSLLVRIGVHYQVANFTSVAASLANGFLWNYYCNFGVRGWFWARFAGFYLVGMTGWAISAVCLFVLVDVLSFNALLSKLTTIAICTVVQFVLNKFVTFRKTMSPLSIARLEWDSAFFGLSVGAVTVSEETVAGLGRALSSCDCELVYAFTSPEDASARAGILEAGGVQFESKVVYRMALDVRRGGSRLSEDFDVARAEALVPGLEELAFQSGWKSRFNADERLRPWFKPMYRVWLKGDLEKGVVFVWPDGVHPKGMATVSKKDGAAKIGLVAVDETCRGQGIGGKLMRAVIQWAAAQGAEILEVVTQGSNLGARRLYESAGFELAEVVDVYHVWRRS